MRITCIVVIPSSCHRVCLENDWIVPTHWFLITESLIIWASSIMSDYDEATPYA